MMKNVIFASFLVIFSNTTFALSSRVINAFYDGRTEELIVNTVKDNGQSGFIRTNEIILITNRISICNSGCLAEVKGASYSSFALVVAGHVVATVASNDSDNLLLSDAFGVVKMSGVDQLVVNLNVLEKDSKLEAK